MTTTTIYFRTGIRLLLLVMKEAEYEKLKADFLSGLKAAGAYACDDEGILPREILVRFDEVLTITRCAPADQEP